MSNFRLDKHMHIGMQHAGRMECAGRAEGELEGNGHKMRGLRSAPRAPPSTSGSGYATCNAIQSIQPQRRSGSQARHLPVIMWLDGMDPRLMRHAHAHAEEYQKGSRPPHDEPPRPHLSPSLSVSHSLCLPAALSVCLCVCVSACLPTCVCARVCVCVRLCVCLFVCLALARSQPAPSSLSTEKSQLLCHELARRPADDKGQVTPRA